MSDKLCRGGNIARFTRPVLPTLHCGDPACVCMGAPIPEALDLDALKQKALAAKGTDEKALWYAATTRTECWSPQEYQGLCSDAAVTRRALADACAADVILALLTAAQQGAEDTARMDWIDRNATAYFEPDEGDLIVGTWSGMNDRQFRDRGRGVNVRCAIDDAIAEDATNG